MDKWKLQMIGVASVVALMAGFTLFHAPAGQAQSGSLQEQIAALQAKVAALEQKLQYVSVSGTSMIITGANVHIRNGLGATNGYPADPDSVQPSVTETNGLGNLIIGYNEAPSPFFIRFGSHNLVIGPYHYYSSFGGLVAGKSHNITAPHACISGGADNTASGFYSSISGGTFNKATGTYSAVSGGRVNTAGGHASAVSGGFANTASSFNATVSGGSSITQSLTSGWSGGSQGPATFIGRFRSP